MGSLFVLSPLQWNTLSKAISNISQGIILFSLAAFFVPKAVGLSRDFSRIVSLVFIFGGFIILIGSVIIAKKGK